MKVKFLLALSIGAQCFAQNMDVNKITSENRYGDNAPKAVEPTTIDKVPITETVRKAINDKYYEQNRKELLKARFATFMESEDIRAGFLASLEKRTNERTKLSAAKKEGVLAAAWTKSKTGTIDGRSWFELSDEEKMIMRERFVKYHQK